MKRRTTPFGRTLISIGVAAATTLGVTAAIPSTVTAAAGDYSIAESRYIAGSILTADAADVVSIGVEQAESFGVTSHTNSGNLDVGVLGLALLDVPGGIQIPLDTTSAGVVGQYASALNDASSVAASGLIDEDGGVGTGITPAPGVAPGPLTLTLSDSLDDLIPNLGSDVVSQLSDVSLTIDAVAARAAQAAPAPATGDYSIGDVELVLTSPTIAAVLTDLNARVASIQTQLDGLDGGLTSALNGVLGLVDALGLGNVGVDVTLPNLATAVSTLTTGTISNPAYPGVAIDLSTGEIIIDLDEILELNGQAPNYDVLTAGTITTITTNVNGTLTALLTTVTDTVDNLIDDTQITAIVELLGIDIVTIDTTVGALLADDGSGIELLGVGIGLDVLGALTPVVDGLDAVTDTLVNDLLNPLVDDLYPALDLLLDDLLDITVNKQVTDTGTFTETAISVSALPDTTALTLDLGNATVGPNALGGANALSLDPDEGPEAGGTVVTITGSNFTEATGVTFDGTVGTSFIVDSDAQITVTTPAHAAGVVDVVVLSPEGNSLPLAFTYLPDDANALSLTPDEGPEAGGTVVTITGTDFTGATGVTFDGTVGTSFIVDSDTQITVTSPAHESGPVEVIVEHPSGNSNPLGFNYLPDGATALSLTPPSGPEAGGTVVTITGTDFNEATGVTFDGTAGTSFSVDSDTQITVTSPAHDDGLVDVTVEQPHGNGGPLGFTYLPDDANALSLTPDEGPEAGGTVVTITGTDFTGATGVTFDGTVGTSFIVDSDTQITVTSPPHESGSVDVIVTSPSGDSNPLAFRYIPDAAEALSLTPDEGPEAGGTVVTITGTDFTEATGATFDGTPGTSFSVDSDTQITVTTPAHDNGLVDVIVLSPAGNSDPLDFTYLPDGATATGIVPNQGPTAGGTVVTITGSDFNEATGVTFDGTPGTSFTIDSDTQITITTPAHVAGPVDVIANSPHGDSDALTFTYVAGQTVITEVDPPTGPTGGGNTVTITGVCFAGADQVLFDGTPATSFTVVNDTTITAVTPAHAKGSVSVSVLGADLCLDGTADDIYTYIGQTVITEVDPPTGPTDGGNTVTISGVCFTGADQVLFDGTPATSFTVVNDTTITAVVPAHAKGSVSVSVLGADDCDDGSTDDIYTYIGQTVITEVDPPGGPTDGGNIVRITGVCFTGADQVLFGTTPATAFIVLDDETIEATVPPGAAGLVDVSIIGADDCQDGTKPDAYTYDDGGDVIEGQPTTTTQAPPTPVDPGRPDLPATGSDMNQMLALALLVLTAGGALLATTRRRFANTDGAGDTTSSS